MQKSYSLEELANLTNSKLIGDKTHLVNNVNSLESASSSDVSFLANSRYEEAMKTSQAGLFCVNPQTKLDEKKNYLISKDPSHTFQQIAEIFLPSDKLRSGFSEIHPTALIHFSAKIAKGVTIGPYAVIDQGATIEEGTIIGAHVFIGAQVRIGKNVHLYPNVTIREGSQIGNRVIIQPGAVIGSCGFGFLPDETGKFQKLQQLGIVILEDDVEIGANTTIDRARFKATIIKQGTKIDNLVQIAHNVEIGKNTAIAAQSGIAGSAKLGNNILLGGQVGVLGHVEVADFVMIATRGGVSKSLLKSGKYRGSPAIPLHEYNRQKVHVRQLKKYFEEVKKLKEEILLLKKSLK